MLGAIIGAALGFVAAPFVSLLTSRPPLREGAERLTVAFRCDACRASVAPIDAVPLISFTRLHGRCRACAAPISRWDLAAEVGSITVGMLVGWRIGMRAELPAMLLLGVVLVSVVLVDFRMHRIATRLIYPAALGGAAFLAVAAAHDGTWEAWKRAVLGGLAASAFLWLLALIAPSGMGDGDARLALLLGLFLGWRGWRHVYLGLLAGFLLGSLAGVGLIIARRGNRKSQIAFGPYLAVGALLFVLWPGIVNRIIN